MRSSVVSGVHAVLEWREDVWHVRDLGSRNGTFIGGTRIPRHQSVPIASGRALTFGDEASGWSLEDDGPPVAAAMSPDGEIRLADQRMLVIPNEEHPEVTVFASEEGAWFLENAEGRSVAVDGQVTDVFGERWTLLLPELLRETADLQATLDRVEDLHFTFHVSRDEEHVEWVAAGTSLLKKIPHRAYNYLLLTLARIRLEEATQSTLTPSEQGWIHRDDLARMLGHGVTPLNLQIFRARKQLSAMNIENPADLIQRRTGSTQLRIGTSHLSVRPL